MSDRRQTPVFACPRASEHRTVDIEWPTFGSFAIAAYCVERYMVQSERTQAEVIEWLEQVLDKVTAVPHA